MSEELKQAISALQCAKRGHCDHAMADEAIAALERALTQRPAAQDEREADEVFLPRRLAATQKLTQLGYRYDSAHGKWLPAPQQATPEPVDWKPIKTSKGGREAVRNFFRSTLKRHDFDDYITGALAADFACVLGGYLQAMNTAATPEPVGEVFQFHPMPEGWPARFRCDSCDGNGEIGEPVSMGHFQPPERQTCPDCGGRGWTSEEHAFNADHMREFAEAHALLTRPAPGVPEDVQRDAERLDWLTFNISGKALRDIGVMWGEHANARAAIDAAMLAAAQAKGGQ